MADYTVVQSKHANGGASTLGPQTFASSVTAGNLLLCVISYDTTTPPTINGGGTWVKAATDTRSIDSQAIDFWYCLSATGGSTTVNLVTSGGWPAAAAVCIAEISRADGQSWTFDVISAAKAFATSGTTANANTSNSITPAAANELLIGYIGGTSGVAPAWTAGTSPISFSLIAAEPGASGSDGSAAFEWAEGGSGSQQATFGCSKSTEHYTSRIAAFGPSSSASSGGSASGSIPTATQSAVSGSATGDGSASGSVPTQTSSAPAAASTGDGSASGAPGTLTASAPAASGTGTATVTASIPTATLSAPVGAGTVSVVATGNLPTLTASTVAGSAMGTGAASGSVPTATCTAPAATATGDANTGGGLNTVTISGVSGSASTAANGSATGSLPTLSISSSAAAATGDGDTSQALPILTCTAPAGAATGTGTASGSLSTVTLTAPAGSASSDESITGSLPTVTLTALAGTATGGSAATGSFVTCTLVAPAGSATGTSSNGNAVGALPTIGGSGGRARVYTPTKSGFF